MSLSETASRLETAAKSNDLESCTQRFPAFRNKLINLHEKLTVIFPNVETEKKKQSEDTAGLYLKENIEKALAAASDYDSDPALKAVKDLLEYDFGAQNNVLLENAAAAFREFNYDAAAEILNRINA